MEKCPASLRPESRPASRADETRPEFDTGDLLLGRYLLKEMISSGGMGVVYAAEDQRLGRSVAIKFARPKQGHKDSATVSFLAEAEATGRLDHPNIIPIYDVRQTSSGTAFSIMKRVHGETLKALIGRRDDPEDPVRLNRLLRALVSTGQAVRYAHARSVLHRDLKPANVMVGRFGEVMLLDWGLSRLVGGDHTTPQLCRLATDFEVVGTPAYLAPEQARYEPEDERTDVHGLGGILFEILAGQPPYRRGNIAETIKMSRTGQTNPLPADCPRALARICRHALDPDPAARYPSVAPMLEDLTAYLDGEPVSVHPDGLAMRIWRWSGRHPTLLGMLLSALLILALLGAAQALRGDRHAAIAAIEQGSTRRQVQRLMAAGSANRLTGLERQQLDPNLARLTLINAADAFLKALRLVPDNPRAHALLAQTYLDLARLAHLHGSKGERAAWIQECRRHDVSRALRKQLEDLESP